MAKKKSKWLDLSAFDDGYDFGDITKTIKNSAKKTSKTLQKNASKSAKSKSKNKSGGTTKKSSSKKTTTTKKSSSKKKDSVINTLPRFSTKRDFEKPDFLSFLDLKREENNVKTLLNKDQEKRSYFQSGLFEDGYDFGDITKSILGTTKDVKTDIGTGIARIGEGVVDAGAYLTGAVAKGFGNEEFAEKTKRFIARDLVDEHNVGEMLGTFTGPSGMVMTGLNKLLNKDKTEEVSVLGDKSDSLVQSAGQLGGTVGLQMVGVPWWVTTGVTGFGAGTQEAFNEGATYGEAGIYGGITAGSEVAFEKLGGIKFGGKALDTGLKKQLSKAVSNKVAKNLLKFGIDAGAEGTEEVLTEITQNIGRGITYEDEKTMQELLTSEEAMDNYIEAFVGGAVMGGGFNAGKLIQSSQTGRDYDTGLTDNEQKVVNKEIENRTAEKQKKAAVETEIDRVIAERTKHLGTLDEKAKKNIREEIQAKLDNGELDYTTAKLSKKERTEIEKQVEEDLKLGHIGIDTIESTLSGEKTSRINELRELLSKTTKDSEKAMIETELRQLEGARAEEMKGLLGKDFILQESYRQEALKGEEFTRETTDKDSDITKELIESAKFAGMNNTRRMHDLFEYTNKIANDTKTKYGFVNNEQLKQLGHEVEGKTINGLVRVNEDGTSKILINVDSNKAINTIIGHETTHLLEGTAEHKKLVEIVKEYATTKGDYDTVLKEFQSLYQGVNADIENEVTAELVADYLFTDETFVTNLSVKEPNIFQKIYDYIKHVYKMATAGSTEKRQLEQVKRRFDKAYKQMSKTVTQETKTNSFTEADSNIKHSLSDSNGRELTKAQQEYFKDSKVRDKNGNLKVVYHGTYEDFTVFKSNEFIDEQNGTSRIKGYFSENEEYSSRYGETKPYYLNMTNPLDTTDCEDRTLDGWKKWLESKGVHGVVFDSSVTGENGRVDTLKGGNFDGTTTYFEWELFDMANYWYGDGNPTEKIQEAGYDGITWDEDGRAYMPFNENQIKSVTNTNPTSDPDIRYSLTDNLGNKLSPAVQKRFENSKVRDEYGDLKVVYHGTPAGEFHIFDRAKGNAEGDFGRGFYFSDSEGDMEVNYEGGGPDFDMKVELRAERIEAEEDIDYEEAKERARAELYKGSNRFEVYLNMEKPAVVGETILLEQDSFLEEYDMDDFDSEDDYYAEVEQLVADTIDNVVWEVDRNLDIGDTDELSQILWEAYAEGGIKVEDLKERIGELGFLDEEGNYIDNEITRQVIESLGYDGIIDPTVSTKFRNMNMEPGTTHYIVFKPNQIKNITNENPTDSPDVRFSFSGENALNANNELLKKAKQMSKDDIDAEVIRKETGWHKGYDGKWRFEIDDSQMKLFLGNVHDGTAKLKDVLQHDVLFANYPQLKEVSFKMASLGNGPYGMYSPGENSILINNELIGDTEEVYNTIVHEIQHAIQQMEGFASGASIEFYKNEKKPFLDNIALYENDAKKLKEKIGLDDFLRKSVMEVREKKKDMDQHWKDLETFKKRTPEGRELIEIEKTLSDLRKSMDDYFENMSTHELYRNTAGEIESRDVEKRRLYSESERNEIAPVSKLDNVEKDNVVFSEYYSYYSGRNEAGDDIRYSISEDDIAPVKRETGRALTEADLPYFEQQRDEAFRNITEDYAPVDEDDYYTEDIAPVDVEDPFKDRDIDEVGNRKVKAYMYENPEVKPFFQEEAGYMLTDLQNSVKGEKFYNDKLYYESSGEQGFFGTKRQTTDDIAYLLDSFKYTYADIEKGLKAIIEDHGAENNAISKRIEFALNDRLMDGYEAVDGTPIPANDDYRALIENMQIQAYSEANYNAWVKSFAGMEAPDYNVSEGNVIEEDVAASEIDNLKKLAEEAHVGDYLLWKHFGVRSFEKLTNEQRKEAKKWFETMIEIGNAVKTNDTPAEDVSERKVVKENVAESKPIAPIKNEYYYEEDTAPVRTNADADFLKQQTAENIKAYMENANKPKEPVFKSNEISPKKKKKHGIGSAWDTVQTLMVNRNRQQDKLAKQTGNKEIKFKGDRVNNIAGEIGGDIFTAQTDNYGNAIGKPLDAPFEQARKNKLDREFDDYLKHQSNIERHRQGKGSKVSAETSQQYVQAYEQAYPKFKEWAKDVYTYNQNLLDNAVKNGLYSNGFREYLTHTYGHYVPFFAEETLQPSVELDPDEIRSGRPIRRAIGGADVTLQGVEQAMMKQTYSYMNAIAKNDLYKEIVQSLGGAGVIPDMRTGGPTDLTNMLYEDESGKYLTAFINGEAHSVNISEELYTELKRDLDTQIRDVEEKLGIITKPLQKVSQLRGKLLTTYNPSFVLTNPIKDFQDALLNSKHTMRYIKNLDSAILDSRKAESVDWYAEQFKEQTGQDINTVTDVENLSGRAKRLYKSWLKGTTWNRFMTSYGNNATQLEYADDVDIDIKKSSRKAKNKGFLNKLGNANNFMEVMFRYPEFKATLEKGKSFTEALYNAREVTTNFGRGGTISKAINRNGATFFNTSVQGMDKFFRNFSMENGAKGFISTVSKSIVLGMLPAIANHVLLGGGYDDEYEALPDYVKSNYYLFRRGNGEFIRIPKGRMISVLGSAARMNLEASMGDVDPAVEKEVDNKAFLENAWSQIGANNPLKENILAPVIQAYQNEAWYGDKLVPTRLEKLPAAEQYDATTDEFSKWLGDKLGTKVNDVLPEKLQVNPYKINYVLDQYSGGIGDILLPMITPEATSGAEGKEMLLAPIRDKFVVNSVDDNRYIGELFDLSDELKVRTNSSEATLDDVMNYEYISDIASQMGELYALKREIQADETLSKSEKYAEVRKVQELINDLASEGIKNYNTGASLEIAYEEHPDALVSLAYDDYNTYNTHRKALWNFKADKDKNGKSIRYSKQNKILDYLNESDLDYGERIILFRQQYPSNDKYNQDIVDYLNSRDDISYEEMESILKALDFKVYSDGTVTW